MNDYKTAELDTMANYVALASAIIRNAAQDYVYYSIQLRKYPENWRARLRRDESLEFFRSPRFDLLSLGADPVYVLNRLDELVDRNEYIVSNLKIKKKKSYIKDEYTED